MVEHKDKDAASRQLYHLAFAKRGPEELYDLRKDPDQLNNVIDDPAYKSVKEHLAKRLTELLTQTKDPRVIGGGDKFDTYPYLGGCAVESRVQEGQKVDYCDGYYLLRKPRTRFRTMSQNRAQ